MDNIALIPLLKATWETIYMVFISSFLSIFFGTLLGILLFLTRAKQPLAHRGFHQTMGFMVNVMRSLPFIILLISILPLTRLLIGTTIGTNAAIVPLTIAAIPFYARIAENAFAEIAHSLIEAAHAMGVTTTQLVTKVLLPESLPALIRGGTLTVVGLIGYSAMAGAVGGGGLGELAISYGYQRFNVFVTLETIIVLVVIVQMIQFAGDFFAKRRQMKPILWMSMVLWMACLGSQVVPLSFKQQKTLRIGVMSGWPEEVMKTAQEVALSQYQLRLKIIVFNDYVLPNTALENHNIDANIFQHVPYLNAQIKAQGYHLTPIAKTFVYPMGFYSEKMKNISELKSGAIVAIPNDPSNEVRTLLLLEKSHLITLKSHGILITTRDIVQNPKHLQFKLLDAAQLPHVLKDADLVALTNDYVAATGFIIQQAILREGPDSPYANIIVVNTADKNNPLFKELIDVMHSKPVVDTTEKIFPNGAAIPAWK